MLHQIALYYSTLDRISYTMYRKFDFMYRKNYIIYYRIWIIDHALDTIYAIL